MKKIMALLLALCMVFAFAACNENSTKVDDPKSEGVMTYAEYAEAPLDSKVVIETYVQATQSWWDNTITAYTQDRDGAYFLYNMACTEADAAKLVPGTKIRVTGYKGMWDGQVEVMDGTFEILEGNYIAAATDVTDKLGTEEIVNYRNQFVSFKGLTVAKDIVYKNGERGDDIYVTFSKGGEETFDFCIEVYLTGPDTDVYKAVEALKVGDKVDVEGFLYWYLEYPNPHITSVTAAK